MDGAEKTLKKTLGDDWKLVIDVDSFGEHSIGSPYRCSRSLICQIVRDGIDRDVKDLPAADIAFINATATKHIFKIRGGPASDTYPVNERLEFAIGAEGVDCKWNCKFLGYDWTASSLKVFLKKAQTDATVAVAIASSGSAPGGGTSKVLSDLNARFASLPDYFNKDFGTLAMALAQFGQWTDNGAPFALEFNQEVVVFDKEVKSGNCDPQMYGQLLVNCGKLLEAALQKIIANADKAAFAAACPTRTIRFDLHDNYRAARRRWVGVPETDLRFGKLVFMCTVDSFLGSRVERIGDDIAVELAAVAAAGGPSTEQPAAAEAEEDNSPKITKKQCSMCKGGGKKFHSTCNGRGCSKCSRGVTNERCGNCYGKGYFEYRN